MAEDTDFSALYRALGITPACTLGEFRQAYRRAVARLHPDQRGVPADLPQLQEINRLYRAATEFQRLHGRLPGAVAPECGAAPAAGAAAEGFASQAPASVPTGEDKAGFDRMSRYFILLALLAIAVLALHALESGRGGVPAAAAPQAVDTIVPAHSDGRIGLGMEKAQVKAIQGTPLGMDEVRWDYGPSWIDFGCGGVVTDWYSSPLRPLRVATAHPTAGDWDAFDAAPPPGC